MQCPVNSQDFTLKWSLKLPRRHHATCLPRLPEPARLGHGGVGTNIEEYQTVFSLTAKLMGGVLDLPTALKSPAIPLESIVGNTETHMHEERTQVYTPVKNTYGVLV